MSKGCTHCGSPEHTKFVCRNRPRPAMKRTRMKQVGKVTSKWLDTRQDWIKQNGEVQVCHYCGLRIGDNYMLTLDHKEARSRRPDLRFDHDNLVPACMTCNALKGSLSHDEYKHLCVSG